MKNLLIFSFILSCFFSYGQDAIENDLPESLVFNFGRSKHGTGDIPGYQYGITYSQNFSKRAYYSIGFEGSLHDRKQIPFFYENPDGSITNSTLNDVTGGFQLVGGIGYNFIASTHHNFGLGIGVLGRYQSTSINYVQETLFPALTQFPIPIRIISNDDKQRTITLGGVLKVNYYYKFTNNWLLGTTAAFQTDTRGDTLPYITIGFGKQF